MLVVAGADGMAAGAIAAQLGGATSSRVSFHLAQLQAAGLVRRRREGRSIIYCAIFTALSDLVAFLMHDCCQGHCKYCDRAIALFANRRLIGGESHVVAGQAAGSRSALAAHALQPIQALHIEDPPRASGDAPDLGMVA